MKNIRNYDAPKYAGSEYEKIEEGIYKTFWVNDDDDLALRGLDEGEELDAVMALKDWKKVEDEDIDDLEYTVLNGKTYYKETDKDDGEITYYENMYDGEQIVFVTSVVFEPEPEFDENEPTDSKVSQYPLEDILEEFFCVVGDDYPTENANDSKNSYVEFSSDDIEDIRNVRSIIGKHVYNRDAGEYVELVIE